MGLVGSSMTSITLVSTGISVTCLLSAVSGGRAAPAVVAKFLETFKEYPPSQRPSSFSIDQLVEKMQKSFEAPH